MKSYEETSIRKNGGMGIRFKARIETAVKYEETGFVIDEYGFVVTRLDLLGDDDLTLDTEIKVVGVGYSREENIDVLFVKDDEYHTFTGVVQNIPAKHYATDLVCKTYTKISVDGQQFVIYGEPVIGNIYDTAQELLCQNPDDEALKKIIADCDAEREWETCDLHRPVE